MSRLSSYNRHAGRSVERLAALSDGLFAIAMTLLVLELRLPEPGEIHSEAELGRALLVFAPRFLVCVMAFLSLGIFWVGQQSQLSQLARADRDLTWIHIAFLFLISVVPLSTRLLADFDNFRIPLLIYWLILVLLGLTLYLAWMHARSAGLIRDDTPQEAVHSYRRRILLAQGLYAFGALLCIISPLLSIAFIILVQIAYAVAIERFFTRAPM
jgi:uncharacterized membrane protein